MEVWDSDDFEVFDEPYEYIQDIDYNDENQQEQPLVQPAENHASFEEQHDMNENYMELESNQPEIKHNGISMNDLIDQMFGSLASLPGRENLIEDFKMSHPEVIITPEIEEYLVRAFDAGAKTKRKGRPFVRMNGQMTLDKYFWEIKNHAKWIEETEWRDIDDYDQLRYYVEQEVLQMIEDGWNPDKNELVSVTTALFAEGAKSFRARKPVKKRDHGQIPGQQLIDEYGVKSK